MGGGAYSKGASGNAANAKLRWLFWGGFRLSFQGKARRGAPVCRLASQILPCRRMFRQREPEQARDKPRVLLLARRAGGGTHITRVHKYVRRLPFCR